MKIIKTVHATKNNTTALNGSICTPILSQVSAVGIQLANEANGVLPRSGVPMARTKTIIAPSHESSAAPIATLWLSALFRFVNNTIKKNARMGGKGISQINVSVVMSLLPLHQINFIGNHRIATTIHRDHKRQTHCYFRGSDRENNNCKHLPCHLRNVTVTPE